MGVSLLYLFSYTMGVSPIELVQLQDQSYPYCICLDIRWEFHLWYLFRYKMGVSPMVFVQSKDRSSSMVFVQ